MAATEERQAKTESDVSGLKEAQGRTDLAISKIGDALDVLTGIVSNSEKDKNTALHRALIIITLSMSIIGGVVVGSYWLIGASQDAKAILREYRITELENFVKENTRVTVIWKTAEPKQ